MSVRSGTVNERLLILIERQQSNSEANVRLMEAMGEQLAATRRLVELGNTALDRRHEILEKIAEKLDEIYAGAARGRDASVAEVVGHLNAKAHQLSSLILGEGQTTREQLVVKVVDAVRFTKLQWAGFAMIAVVGGAAAGVGGRLPELIAMLKLLHP